MCKIVIIPNASKVKDFKDFSETMAYELSDQSDGFGFAAQGKKGVFGSRTLSPSSFADEKPPSFAVGNRYDFGEQSEVIGAAMFHGRVSTNYISIRNTHPIEREGWYLIHNGVVTHHGKKYKKNTSNDSEDVLFELMNGGITSVAKNLTGYYAVGAIDDNGLVHVIRDSIASLYVAYSEKLETFIFATTTELIDAVGTYVKEDLTAYRVKNDIYLVFDQGKLIKEESFVSAGYDDHSASWSSHSLGYNLTPSASWGKDDIPEGGPTDDEEFFEYESGVQDDEDFEEFLDTFDLADVSDSFWEELDYINRDYRIIDHNFKDVDIEDFRKMPLKKQVLCEIRRPDGTLLNPFKLDKAS